MHEGRTIAQYEIGEPLGRGGMGVVYRARDTKLDRPVALKFLAGGLGADEEAKERFIREAKAASALDHPNICTIHDISETEDGDLYIVMALYEGRTLKDRMKSEEFSIRRATDIVRQIARALTRAHEAGIVHRDVKPANIIVSDDDQVRLLDFGLAKLNSGLDLTRTGSTLGTVGYMSPEQARGEEVTPAADIWALGVVGYELLAGRNPFAASNEPATLYRILNEEPAPLSEVRSDTPEWLEAVVLRALAKNPADRFGDGAAYLAAMERTEQAGRAAASPGRSSAGSPSGPRRYALSALTVLAIGAAMFALPRLGPRSPDAATASASAPASPDVIAVLPFTVRGGAELAYLGEGMVDLISEKLDGAGPLQSIDPRSVIGRVSTGAVDVTDLQAARDLARSLGAGRFITGEVTGAGAQVVLTASLRPVGDGFDVPETAKAEGPVGDLLNLIDDLSTDLLAGSLSGPGARLQTVAARTSSSIDATKEFLRGEQLHRAGLYREASAAYNRAIELDSTFALAHYKKSYVNDYTEEPDDYRAAEAALRHSGALSTRDQALIQALRDKRFGLHERAEQAFRTHLLRYPDEVGALVQVGEILFHANPRRGRPMGEAREWFERVLEVEPGNIEANLHLARLDDLEGNLEGLRERVDYFERVVPNSERSIEVAATYAFSAADTAKQREVGEALRTGPWYFYAYAGIAAARHDPGSAEVLLAGRPSGFDYLDAMVPQLELSKGKYEAVERYLSSAPPNGHAGWAIFDASLILAGLAAPERATIESVLERVQAADPEEIVRTAFIPFHDVVTPEITAFARDWYAAHLLAFLGRFDDAWTIQRRLAAAQPFFAMGTLQADAAAGLEAELLYRSGDPEGALQVLRGLRYDQTSTMIVLSFGDGTRARYLRAELEMEIGDPARAEAFYQGFLGSYSHHDRVYIAVALRRLAQIAEMQGRTEDAIQYYARFVEAWKECDPALVPIREEAEARLGVLLAREGR